MGSALWFLCIIPLLGWVMIVSTTSSLKLLQKKSIFLMQAALCDVAASALGLAPSHLKSDKTEVRRELRNCSIVK